MEEFVKLSKHMSKEKDTDKTTIDINFSWLLYTLCMVNIFLLVDFFFRLDFMSVLFLMGILDLALNGATPRKEKIK